MINDNHIVIVELDKSIKIEFIKNKIKVFLNCDKEQIARAFFNLIKNSIESIQEKYEKKPDFKKKISIEIISHNDHIQIILIDNGLGFSKIKGKIKDIINPYFTTKKNGSGLGLSIVNKIINDHDGELKFYNVSDGAKIEVNFILNVDRNFNS